MLHGPSTAFSYAKDRPRARRARRRACLPVVNTCDICEMFIVGLRSPGSGRTVWVPASRFFQNMALAYSHRLHGRVHYHPGGLFTREDRFSAPSRPPRKR